jgi:hypothetical protein
MQPTNLKAIARDATLRDDTKTLFDTLDLLERVVPLATFMDFCTELEELRPARGAPTAALIRFREWRALYRRLLCLPFCVSSSLVPTVTCRSPAVRHQLDS